MGTVAKLSLLGALFALSACSGSSPATAAASKLPPGSGGDDAGEVQGGDAGGTVTPPTGDDAGSPAADAGGGEDAATGKDAGEVDAGELDASDAAPSSPTWGCWFQSAPLGPYFYPFYPCVPNSDGTEPPQFHGACGVAGNTFWPEPAQCTSQAPVPTICQLRTCQIEADVQGVVQAVTGISTHACSVDSDCAGLPNNPSNDGGPRCGNLGSTATYCAN